MARTATFCAPGTEEPVNPVPAPTGPCSIARTALTPSRPTCPAATLSTFCSRALRCAGTMNWISAPVFSLLASHSFCVASVCGGWLRWRRRTASGWLSIVCWSRAALASAAAQYASTSDVSRSSRGASIA